VKRNEAKRTHSLKIAVKGPDDPTVLCSNGRDEQVTKAEALAALCACSCPGVQSFPRRIGGPVRRDSSEQPFELRPALLSHTGQQFDPHRRRDADAIVVKESG
jgi:hypothetical protein